VRADRGPDSAASSATFRTKMRDVPRSRRKRLRSRKEHECSGPSLTGSPRICPMRNSLKSFPMARGNASLQEFAERGSGSLARSVHSLAARKKNSLDSRRLHFAARAIGLVLSETSPLSRTYVMDDDRNQQGEKDSLHLISRQLHEITKPWTPGFHGVGSSGSRQRPFLWRTLSNGPRGRKSRNWHSLSNAGSQWRESFAHWARRLSSWQADGSPGQHSQFIRTGLDEGVNFSTTAGTTTAARVKSAWATLLRDGYRQKAFLMSKIDGRTKTAAASPNQRVFAPPSD